MPLSITEQLAYSTVRLECDTPNGLSTGTGFFFKFLEDGDQHVPVIITNKHVVNNATTGRFVMTKANDEGNPIQRDFFTVTLNNFEQFWRFHPDDNIDLCAMPIAPVLNAANERNQDYFIEYLKDLYYQQTNKKTNFIPLRIY